MSAHLMSKHLLEREIERYEKMSEMTEDDKILYSLAKRELAMMEKLKIELFDICGTIEEVTKRIENQAVYLMHPKEYEGMKEKAERYNSISDIVNGAQKRFGDLK